MDSDPIEKCKMPAKAAAPKFETVLSLMSMEFFGGDSTKMDPELIKRCEMFESAIAAATAGAKNAPQGSISFEDALKKAMRTELEVMDAK